MNLADLEAFVSVVDHGSVVAAATRLHLTQSAVTRRIQNLEDVLGVCLLDRQTRPSQPTPAGKETYEFAKPVLSSVSDLRAAIVHNGEPFGDFRFGVSRGLGDLALTHPIDRLRTECPKLKIQAFAQWSKVLLERLMNRTLDAAVVLLPEGSAPPPSLVGECLGTEIVVVVTSKAKPFSRSSTLEELSSHAWIVNPPGCSGRQLIEGAMLQQRLPFVIAVEAEGNDLQLSLVSQGVGLCLVMPQVISSSPFRKQLKTIQVKDFVPRQDVWVLHSRHIGRLAAGVRCLRDAVKQHLHNRRSKSA
jgi:DNA-binding transcriptional LysR family regulator